MKYAIVDNLPRHLAAILETYLEDNGVEWILEQEAITLVKGHYPRIPDAIIQELITSEDVLTGSRLKWIDLHGHLVLKLKP